jgi:Cellulase (glycosyl hydrolase family 5)
MAFIMTIAASAAMVILGSAAHAHAATCHHERGPFHTRGSVVTGSTGRYIPYGINVTGLAHQNWSGLTTSFRAELQSTDHEDIDAIANFWCGNTVRVQVGQENLVGSTGHVNQTFLAAVMSEVRYAESRGLVVALNDQWQLDGHKFRDSMPTKRTEAFWGSLASHFGRDPQVVFDLYNEPEQWVHCGWTFWHSGGRCGDLTYIGMQPLANFVRARSSNLFWIEGISAGADLSGAMGSRITGDGPLEYSEHRPPAPHQYRTWDAEFGYIANQGHAPVLDGEWADYARTDAPWACWDNAPVSAPRFLSYLGARRFGLIMTQLVMNQLIQSTNLNDPTHFRSNWACRTGLDQGVGHQAQQWFIRQNG